MNGLVLAGLAVTGCIACGCAGFAAGYAVGSRRSGEPQRLPPAAAVALHGAGEATLAAAFGAAEAARRRLTGYHA